MQTAHKIRIVFLIDYIAHAHGGTESQLLHILRRLDPTRFEPFLCCLWNTPWISKNSPPCEHAVLFRKPVRWHSTLRSLIRIRRFLRAGRFDIVHTFFPTANVLGPLAARLGSIPVILTSRRDMGYWKRRQDALLLRVVRNIPTCVVANSHAVKNQTVATEGIPPDRIIVVHNGVDAEPYRRDFHAEVAALRGKYRLPKDALIVGVVANYHRAVKGVEYFVEAASPVSAEVPEAFFFVVGFGPPEKEQHLQERIKRLHLQSRFVLTGLQSNVKPFLAMFDVAVMPSLSEGFSNSLLEYMAAGLPCVATDVGGNKELVVDGETGFLVKPASAQALAEKIIVVLRNPGLREKMGRMAQERVRTHFWMTRMIKQLETLYEHLYLCSPQAKAAARRGFGPSGGGGHRRAFPNLTGETRHGVKTT